MIPLADLVLNSLPA